MQNQIELLQNAIKILEKDGKEGLHTASLLVGLPTALAIFTTILRVQNGSLQSYPASPEIDMLVEEELEGLNQMKFPPDDLSQFVPYGNDFYGLAIPMGINPIKNAPPQEISSGSVIYFGCNFLPTQVESFLEFMDINGKSLDYKVYVEESRNPFKDGYITQVRIVSKFALNALFESINDLEYKKFPNREMNLFETLLQFTQNEKARWGTDCFTNRGLYGMFGGDGDMTREELCFGFAVENEYYGIYRIWSRAWLVTK